MSENTVRNYMDKLYKERYDRQLVKIKKKLENDKPIDKYNKVYWRGYEKGIKRIYIGSKEVSDDLHQKILELKDSTEEKYRQLARGYILGMVYAEENLIPCRASIRKGRPPISEEKTIMIGCRIPKSYYEELNKILSEEEEKNRSAWARKVIMKEISRRMKEISKRIRYIKV